MNKTRYHELVSAERRGELGKDAAVEKPFIYPKNIVSVTRFIATVEGRRGRANE